MHKLNGLILTLLLLLSGCGSAPRAQVAPICPRIPALDQVQAAQVPSFTEATANFLRGNLTGHSAFLLTLPSAKLPTIKPEN